MKNIPVSSVLRSPLHILAIILTALVIFSAGMFVGYHKAQFSYDFDENYAHDMNDPHSMLAPFMHDTDHGNPHGAIGQIVSINAPFIMVKNPFEAEKVIIIGPDTMIRHIYGEASTSDLAVGDHIIALGAPDQQGQVHATFIRILPPPPDSATSTASSSTIK